MKKLVAVLVIAVAGLGVAAIYLLQQLNDERRQNADLQARVTTLESAQLAQASAIANQPVAASVPAPQVGATAAQPAAPEAAPPAAKQPAAANVLAGAKEVLSSPEGRGMVQPMLRAMLAQQYPDLAKELGLSQAEADKLLDTIVKQQLDLSAESIDLIAGGGNPDPAALQEMQRKTQEKQRQNEAELAAMLGNKYPQFQEYQSTLAARQQMSQLNAVLTASGAPLDDAQSKQLTAALSAEQKRISQEQASNPMPAGKTRQETLDLQLQRISDNNRRLADAASAYLTSAQLDSYRKMLERQENLQRNVIRAMGAQGAQGQAGSGTR
jgi:hypothetical protein